jgi:hypothetical protein
MGPGVFRPELGSWHAPRRPVQGRLGPFAVGCLSGPPLVRQIGIIGSADAMSAVAIAVEPASGSFW